MIILGFLPVILPVTHLNMVIEIAFFALFAMTFSMLFGHGGLLSFGHAAYFGIGAYTVALLFKHFASGGDLLRQA
jgi:branched-chain amino acid transport system permease protein